MNHSRLVATIVLPTLMLPILLFATPTSRPTTSPSPWFAKINRYIDPLENDPAFKDDPQFDPAGEILPYTWDDPHITREQAFQALLTTTVFAHEIIGASAHRSGQTWAFVTLMRQPDARNAFEDLVKRGRLAGQLYGLCGLYYLDRPSYEKLAEPFRSSPDQVRTFFGCISRAQRVATFFDDRSSPTGYMKAVFQSMKKVADEYPHSC